MRMAYAAQLAHTLGLPLVVDTDDQHPLLLVVTDQGLEIVQADSTDGPVRCEFTSGAFGYRRTMPVGRQNSGGPLIFMMGRSGPYLTPDGVLPPHGLGDQAAGTEIHTV